MYTYTYAHTFIYIYIYIYIYMCVCVYHIYTTYTKGLDLASFQRKISEPRLREDFENFCRWMRVKCHF